MLLTKLPDEKLALCQRTISPNTFYMIVGDALSDEKPLSVVRMADGEYHFMRDSETGDPGDLASPPAGHGSEWMERMGCAGITKGEVRRRLNLAAVLCTYFAPSVTGIQCENWDMYQFWPRRECYVDNFFVNAWTEEMKAALFKKAGHVLFLHRTLTTADAMQIRAKGGLGVKVTYIKLSNWRDADEVVEKAKTVDAPLVLFAAGPGSKFIGPEIAMGGRIPKVTLDIGHAADHWTFEKSLKHIQRA